MAIRIWDSAVVLFPAIATIHLMVSPFTKVEESFNIQAIHDILAYGLPINDAANKFRTLFDHMTFPGAVPRTFIGSLILSSLAKPQIWISGLDGRVSQFLVRAILGAMNGVALVVFGAQVRRAFGPITGAWYVALQASQFHVWYYASRTLPNMFAFFLSTLGLAWLSPDPTASMIQVKRTRLGLYLLTVATVIFRSELAILLAAHCVWLFLKAETFDGKILLIRKAFIPSIIPGALVALLLTVTIDTYFWQSSTYLWPELSAFLSNVFPSKDGLGASAWGTQPWYWYLAVALPRLLMNQTPMVYLFFISPRTIPDGRVFDSLIPSFIYMIIYSILPHKETRFMFPIVPSLTLVAAITCTRLTINMHRSILAKLLFYAAVVSTIITAFISHAILLPLSAQNYPGGNALEELHSWYYWNYQTMTPLHNNDPSHPQVHIHLTNLALQSGVTRFLEQPPPRDDAADIAIDTSDATSVKGSYKSHDEPKPIVLPGDGNHPALTIYPKSPSATSTPSPPSRRSYANPTWIYDKSPSSNISSSAFWSNFDFLVIESPAKLHPPLTGPWSTIERITTLSLRPVVIPVPPASDSRQYHRRYDPPWTSTLSEHLEYWTTWTQYEHLPWVSQEFDPVPYENGRGGTTWLLARMYPSWLAIPLTRIHDRLHDFLRFDIGVTGGKWIEIPLVTKLYILRNCAAGGAGCEDAVTYPIPEVSRDSPSGEKGHDNGAASDYDEQDPPMYIDGLSGNLEQMPIAQDWDTLGPLVVNKDGTLSRLENWKDMNMQERKKTVEYLRKRNLLRMEEPGPEEAVM